jgi:hypothetical protein
MNLQSVAPGVYVYQITKKGLALQATVQGTKYSKDDDLNKSWSRLVAGTGPPGLQAIQGYPVQLSITLIRSAKRVATPQSTTGFWT